MNCESTRNRILALPDPAGLSDALQAHINECAACRMWHAQLIQVEAVVVSMTVPATDGRIKRQLLAQFKAAPPAKPKANKIVKKIVVPKTPITPAAERQPIGERLARMWPAGLIAAAVLVGAIAWSLLSGKSDPDQVVAALPPDPMLQKVVAAKTEVDTADSTAKRVDGLAKLADVLHEGARSLSKVTPEEMPSLAKNYELVVCDALVAQARALTEEERRTTLPKYRDMLIRAQQDANTHAADAPEGSRQALKDIAKAAETGRIELAKLIQGRGT
jgi:hypothetical protein